MKLSHTGILPLLALPLIATAPAALATPEPATVQIKQTSTLIQAVTQTDETLYFNPDTIYELPLRVDTSVVVNGITLPAGTVIEGRLEPVEGGLRYVTSHIQAGGLRQDLNAASDVLEDIKDPRETGAGAIVGDAAIGAAGGAIIGAILGGGVSAGEVIGGAATGVIIGNVTAQRVVVIEAGEPVILYAGS
ncbi:MAG: hypothetical protein ACFB0C_15215 [Leptolyngbyaceae cyanobacterium]